MATSTVTPGKRKALRLGALALGARPVGLLGVLGASGCATRAHHQAHADGPIERRTEPRVRVETELGAFIITVFTRQAPVTAANFLAYVDAGALTPSWIYRLVSMANQPAHTVHKIEVVQWGLKWDDANPAAPPVPRPPIRHESTRETGLRHLDGTLSMARSQPGTAAGEFFICIGEQPSLDFGGLRNPDGQGFAAFGQVTEGMDVVRAIHQRAEAEQFLKASLRIASVRRI